MIDTKIIRFTDYGCYYPTDIQDLESIKSLMSGKTFLDLGSGDDRVVLFAQENGAMAEGFEIEHGYDMFDFDWNKYDLIYYYLCGCKDEWKIPGRLLDFKGLFILYHKECQLEAIQMFEKNLELKKIKEYPYINVYSKNGVING